MIDNNDDASFLDPFGTMFNRIYSNVEQYEGKEVVNSATYFKNQDMIHFIIATRDNEVLQQISLTRLEINALKDWIRQYDN